MVNAFGEGDVILETRVDHAVHRAPPQVGLITQKLVERIAQQPALGDIAANKLDHTNQGTQLAPVDETIVAKWCWHVYDCFNVLRSGLGALRSG